MSAKDKHSHYSAGDIFKYLRGDLSAREMQAMEAAALEDPFLADALEGMGKDHSLRGEEAFREDMVGLKNRLDARIAGKDRSVVLPFYRSAWKVAAAILLLAGLGAITYRALFRGASSEPSLASAENKMAPAGKATTPASPQEDRAAASQSPTDQTVLIGNPSIRISKKKTGRPGSVIVPRKTDQSAKRDIQKRSLCYRRIRR